MTLEYLAEQKLKYQDKINYFKEKLNGRIIKEN